MKVLRVTWAIIAVAVAGGAFALFFAGWRQSASGPVSEGLARVGREKDDPLGLAFAPHATDASTMHRA